MYRRLQLITALASLMLTMAVVRVHAGDMSNGTGQRREDEFKAAYLFNFMKFVDWPSDSATDPLTVCFLGGVGVYEALSADIDSKRVGARQLIARQLDSTSTATACDGLYIDAEMAELVSITDGLAVLTVSDAPGFATHGGMIELFTDHNRLRFFINVGSAQKAGLRISSDLLKLAAGVRREGP